jgi:phosphate starvation-inducible PhoH-like protein
MSRKKHKPIENHKQQDEAVYNYANERDNKKLKAKTEGQQKYIDTINKNTITLCVGPPGSGKSYCSVGIAIEALRRGQVDKIVLSRPILEACGEEIGAIPGSVEEKVGPYLRPLLEAVQAFTLKGEYALWKAEGKIEIIPFAYMRGLTLSNTAIIIDEANNLTHDQMKLVLTRIGLHSYCVIQGDPKQSDLPYNKQGALIDYMEILDGLPFVGTCELTKQDIVRSPFIASILDRIEEWEESHNKTPKGYIQ